MSNTTYEKLSDESHEIKELQQEKVILNQINGLLNNKTKRLENCKQELEKKLSQESHKLKEVKQENILLVGITTPLTIKKKNTNKTPQVLILTVFVFTSALVFSFYENSFQTNSATPIRSNYVIENLKGDTVDTWVSWRLTPTDTLHFNIINTAGAPQEKVDAVIGPILSTKTRLIDDALFKEGQQGTGIYYDGWQMAMKKATEIKPTKFYIPTKMDIIDPKQGEGQIVIELVKEKSPDGYAGFTKSITDQNQILKSKIVIFDALGQSTETISKVARHEIGHALGLAHSTAPEDLMAQVITTKYPYIGECDLSAISGLYDDNKKSEVICER